METVVVDLVWKRFSTASVGGLTDRIFLGPLARSNRPTTMEYYIVISELVLLLFLSKSHTQSLLLEAGQIRKGCNHIRPSCETLIGMDIPLNQGG